MNARAKAAERTTGARSMGAIVVAGLLLFADSTGSQEAAKPADEAPQRSAEQKAEAQPPAQPTQETPTPPAASPEQAENQQGEEGTQAPERFIPTQKSSADNSATFPIDI